MLTKLIKSLLTIRKPSQQPGKDVLPTELKPGWDAFYNRQFQEALSVSQAYLQSDSSNLYARMLEGLCLSSLGDRDLALKKLERLVLDFPESAVAWKSFGRAAQEAKQFKLMFDSYRESLAIDPMQADVESLMGSVMFDQRCYAEARKHFENAIILEPCADAYSNLGILLYTAGRPDLAFEAYSHGLQLDPNKVDIHRGRVTTLSYINLLPDETEKNAYSEYAAALYRQVRSQSKIEKKKKKHDHLRIRLGYLTSDFRDHPVARNMLPIFEHHDHLQFEIFVYADLENSDAATKQFQMLTDTWRDIRGVKDQDVAKMIEADEIDILVILAGHMDRNRPQICIYRPSPIQISLHDVATTGFEEMDYLISDVVMTPPDSAEWFCERIVRLPSFYIHYPILYAPEVGTPPMVKNGHVTFGSFNNPCKLNPETIKLWSAVLSAVPHAKLCLKYLGRFTEPEVREWCLSMFQSHGISEDRLLFPDIFVNHSNHLAIYQTIDIALDPLPFNGSTTTFEALWMGVPVVTLLGHRMVGRWSASMLRAIKHGELIATTEDEYVKIASQLANDQPRLASLRKHLREEVQKSPLCNAARRTRQFERVYTHLWKQCVSTQIISDLPNSDLVTMGWHETLTEIVTLWEKGHQGSAGLKTEKLLASLPEVGETEGAEINKAAVQLMSLGALFLAVRLLEHAWEKCPRDPNIICNIGIIYSRVHQYEKAMAAFKRGIELFSDNVLLLFNYALMLHETSRLDEAKSVLLELLAKNNNYFDALMALSLIEKELGQLKSSLQYAQSAFDLAMSGPRAQTDDLDVPAIALSLGDILRDLGELDEALRLYDDILIRWPDHAGILLARSRIYFLRDEHSLAWQGYAARKRIVGIADRSLGKPEWEQQDLTEKTLLILGEQGVSEDLLFAPCYFDIIKKAKHVVIDCEPQLQAIYSRSFPNATVLGSPRQGLPIWVNRAPQFDFQVQAGSLPLLLNTNWRAAPVSSAYLKADPFRSEVWYEKLQKFEANLKVGLFWQSDLSRADLAGDTMLPLEILPPILKIPEVTFVLLQESLVSKTDPMRKEYGVRPVFWEDSVKDVEELSALIDCLDVIIAPCSSFALLAAALGKIVFILAPTVPPWGYTLSNEILTGYPGARLFRCQSPGDWKAVGKTICENLATINNPRLAQRS